MSFQKYEQYGKIRSMEYISDTVEDLKELPHSAMGSTCYVIENAVNYMCNSKNEWIAQTKSSGGNSGGADIDLSNYMTKSEVEQAIATATEGMITEVNFKTINGVSLIGEGDLNIATLIPDEEIASELEMEEAIADALTIGQL
jgi:hypothetical protein